MKKEDWIWMPHAGHFILGNKCRFHLNTYVGGYIVSTVGDLWPERSSREIHASIYDPQWHAEHNHLKGDTYDRAYMERFGYDDIGADRKFETMVFKAKREEHEDYQCCPWTMVSGSDEDYAHWRTGSEAREGHYELCEKWSKDV